MSTSKEEVKRFLIDFKQKMQVFEVVFMRSRSKNLQTVVELELNNIEVRKQLEELTVENYYRGPIDDRDDGPDLWEFGKSVKNKEVYVKVHMGKVNKSVICVSFHFPESTINYPLR